MSTIHTVAGQIEVGQLGVTYSHDHLIFRPAPPISEQDPDLCLDDFDAALTELGFFKAAGGQALVEMTTAELGRAPEQLRALSERSGVHLIAATGYNKAHFCAAIVARKSVDEIVQDMVRDLTQGMDGTPIRAGLIKASSSKNTLLPAEKKVFEAAIEAHHRTGAPISTHTEAGTYALEQIQLLLEGGVRPEHICIGHLDRNLDWDYHQQVAATGVFMLFDQIGKEKYYPDERRIEFIRRLIAAGHGDQILLSGDQARKSSWPSYGFGYGPGLTYILWRFVPWMISLGVARADVDRMLIGNPARAFAWRD